MLPGLINGTQRACFGVTEPNSGSDTLRLETKAEKKGDRYIITGRKMWISTAQRADKILLLARTTAYEDCKKPTQGLSLFYTDFDRTQVETREIPKMGRAAVDTNLLFFDGWSIPAADRIGNEGDGFKMCVFFDCVSFLHKLTSIFFLSLLGYRIMHGMNAERILLASEALGLGYAGLRRAGQYAIDRHVFGRPIGQNQSIQHPLAQSWMQLEGARLLVYLAAKLCEFDRNFSRFRLLTLNSDDDGVDSGEYANAAK